MTVGAVYEQEYDDLYAMAIATFTHLLVRSVIRCSGVQGIPTALYDFPTGFHHGFGLERLDTPLLPSQVTAFQVQDCRDAVQPGIAPVRQSRQRCAATHVGAWSTQSSQLTLYSEPKGCHQLLATSIAANDTDAKSVSAAGGARSHTDACSSSGATSSCLAAYPTCAASMSVWFTSSRPSWPRSLNDLQPRPADV